LKIKFPLPRATKGQGRLQKAWSAQGNILELLLPQGWPENFGTVRWRLRGTKPGVAPHGEVTELNQIPGLSAYTRVHVWTPAAETLLTNATLPTRSRAKIQQALPFTLEEQLIGEPDKLHFAYREQENGSLAVAVTARTHIQGWVTKLKDSGLHPASLCPAVLVLPLNPNSWTAAFVGAEIWVRTGTTSGFACPGEEHTPPAMLHAALREARSGAHPPETLSVLQPPADFDLNAWSSELGLAIQAHKQDFWATHQEATPAINLLQGLFAPTAQMRQTTQALRPAAIMLGLWLIGSLGFNTWEWWQLKRAHDNFRQEMTAVFKRTFPEAQVVVDPALQMQRLLGDLEGKGGKGTGASLLPILGEIAPVMQSNKQIKLRGMQFGDNKLTLEITLPDFQVMETVKAALVARGMQVEVLGANSTAAGIEGRLRLGQNKS
jgi:general secretion pathway protein L